MRIGENSTSQTIGWCQCQIIQKFQLNHWMTLTSSNQCLASGVSPIVTECQKLTCTYVADTSLVACWRRPKVYFRRLAWIIICSDVPFPNEPVSSWTRDPTPCWSTHWRTTGQTHTHTYTWQHLMCRCTNSGWRWCYKASLLGPPCTHPTSCTPPGWADHTPLESYSQSTKVRVQSARVMV